MEHLQDGHYVRLRSRVHGTYLHADEDGHGVSLHHRRDSMNAAWAVHLYHQGNADALAQHMLLHSAAYGRYLVATNFSTKMHWVVEPIPVRAAMPLLRRPNRVRIPFTRRNIELPMPSRVIVYVRAGADGSRIARGAFVFEGKSVFDLRKTLIGRLEATMGVSDVAMCVEAGTFGRPTPLVVDLPRSRQNLHILVFAVGTPAHAGVRYPDVDAV